MFKYNDLPAFHTHFLDFGGGVITKRPEKHKISKIASKNNPKIDKTKRGQKHDVYDWFLSRFCMHLWMDDNHFHTTYNIGEVTKIL